MFMPACAPELGFKIKKNTICCGFVTNFTTQMVLLRNWWFTDTARSIVPDA